MAEAAHAKIHAAIRVFVSYAWESVEYRLRVQALATRLREDTIDAQLDKWHLDGTFPDFMSREVGRADKILVVCSPGYRARVHAMENGQVSGAGWEAMLITARIFHEGLSLNQIVPALFRGTWKESAPGFLQGLPYEDLTDAVTFEQQYSELLRRLLGHAEPIPSLGKKLPPDIDPEPVPALRGVVSDRKSSLTVPEWPRGQPAVDPQRFSFDELRTGVKRLTDEQYLVIDFLRLVRRVRVSGCAGSGKTLVAAEKAIRLSKGSFKVLFLCHSPELAAYVRSHLTIGTSVQVIDFCSWVRNLAGTTEEESTPVFTHFDEPSDTTLAKAVDCLSKIDQKYDAVIVDEAQDFRDDWWLVVEAGLRQDSIFYIFHDDNQSLLPRRGTYPDIGPQIDLSRNCRNDGRIFELMRCLADGLPKPELPPQGRAIIHVYRIGEEIERVSMILGELFRQQLIKNTVVLWAGTEPIDQAPVSNCELLVSSVDPWQEEVKQQFGGILYRYRDEGVILPTGGKDWVVKELSTLSSAPYPTDKDIGLVKRVADSFGLTDPVLQKANRHTWRRRFHWVTTGSSLTLQSALTLKKRVWGANLIVFFQRDDWDDGIPKPMPLKITPYYMPIGEGSVPLYGVADFKGLEADVVILLMRGGMLAHRAVVYVGVSRSRAVLYVVADELSARALPASFRWDHALTG